MEALLVIVVAVVGVVGGMMLLSRPHTVVRIERGRARLVRGSPPPALLRDLDDVARHAPSASGRVEVRGQGTRLHIEVPGLDEPVGQRVRNVVLLYRQRLG